MRSLVRLVVLLASLGGVATAAPIFDNGAPQLDPGGQGFFSDAAPDLFAPGFPQFIAEDFSLTDPALVARMTFYGAFFPGNVPDASFGINFYSDLGGNPDALIAARSVTPTATALPGTISGVQGYRFDATFAPVSLDANTTYWVSVFNTNPADLASDFVWAFTTTPVVNAAFSVDLNLWFPLPPAPSGLTFRESAFQLAVIPEPSSMSLMGLGLILAARRLRRRAS